VLRWRFSTFSKTFRKESLFDFWIRHWDERTRYRPFHVWTRSIAKVPTPYGVFFFFFLLFALGCKWRSLREFVYFTASEEEDTESGSAYASASASVASTAGRRKQHRPLRSNYLDRSIEAKKKVNELPLKFLHNHFRFEKPLNPVELWNPLKI